VIKEEEDLAKPNRTKIETAKLAKVPVKDTRLTISDK
jgi:hypothetical protein